ncbi:MAG: glutamate--tRNA ligase [Candidatus Saccharimonadales bacterium]
MKEVRTRFAPSPTGYMHVGGVRTALFAWLVARQANGKFILRIEDTDTSRQVEGSEAHIIETLRILGLDYDEGPDKQGKYGPYRQSQRLDMYKEWGNKLINIGRAYADPYTPKEVERFRDKAKQEKKPFLFRDFRPSTPPIWDGPKPLRFLSDPKDYSWHDEIMGDLSAKKDSVDDFILIKSDGYPTYNFAHIVDDNLMQITHVLRSQEFLASIPRYLNLYEALDIQRPLFATVPFVLGPDGKKKLSKRDGAKDVLQYIKDGYLPETLINFMASLGWNDGTTQEIYSFQELIDKFKLSEVQKSGARFDEQRLVWMNGAHIRKLDIDELYMRAKEYLPKSSANYDSKYQKKVLRLVQERIKYFAELPNLTSFFFENISINHQLISQDKRLNKFNNKELKEWLQLTRQTLIQSDFKIQDITDRLNKLLSQTGQKPAVLFSLIRIAITQAPSSPSLFETIEVLGKQKVLERLDQQLENLK